MYWILPHQADAEGYIKTTSTLWVEYSQTLQHSCAAHTTRSLFIAEKPVTLPGPRSIETLSSDPVTMAMPPDVYQRSTGQVKHPKQCLFWCHITAVTHVVFLFLAFPEGSSHFLRSCQPNAFSLSSKHNCSLKTTVRQLCQHEHPSSGKHFYDHRLGESSNTLRTLTIQRIKLHQHPTLVIPARNSE
ncbi:hypothetical protein GOODEAATRI_010159 [Goodea atripinnis]|uniref:Uncharacterized protein n=1 Tax=Goodea atripinnis TaxID=208336 RepID=A0ABV0PWS9_9TELE